MGKVEFFLLLFICLSMALVDPPIMEVHENNTKIAPQEILHTNVLNKSEKTPDFKHPFKFLYVEILTVTPSVNNSITSSMHPELIWLIAEDHNKSITKEHRGGPDDCEDYKETWTYEEMEIENIEAYYTLNGILYAEGENYSYITANKSKPLAANESDIKNPSTVPFEQSLICKLSDFISEHVLGDMFNISCNDESLVRASPYVSGTMNITHRNLTLVRPHLNVTIKGNISIFYSKNGFQEYWAEKDKCKTMQIEGNGTLIIPVEDNDSYEVQNDYMTILVFSPKAFDLNGNTSEETVYHFSFLSNSNLYKYYSIMDNMTAAAEYFYYFKVVNDSFGTQKIMAIAPNKTFVPEENVTNFTDRHRTFTTLSGVHLRTPTEITNMSYNYSRVYKFREVFYNLSEGPHHADLEFYTWFGRYNASSDIFVRSSTILKLWAVNSDKGEITLVCNLTSRKKPLSGAQVELRIGDETKYATTDASGICKAPFKVEHMMGTAYAKFYETPRYEFSKDDTLFGANRSVGFGKDLTGLGFLVLFIFSLLFAMAFMGLLNSLSGFMAGGVAIGAAKDKLFPFAPKGVPKGKGMVRKKKGKELAMSLAAAASGGAGSAAAKKAGDKAAKKAVKKQAKKKVAKKAIDHKKQKAMREAAEKKAKKKPKKMGKKQIKGKVKKMTMFDKFSNQLKYGEQYKKKEKYLDKREVKPELAKKFKTEIQDPHIETINKKIQSSCNSLNELGIHIKHKINEIVDLPVELKIVKDSDMNKFIKSVDPEDKRPYETLGITIDNTVYIRESKIGDERYLQEVIKHENYHPNSKVNYDTSTIVVEGFNEIMKYEDIVNDKNISKEVRNKARMVDGIYRVFGAQQYLVKEIIGKDNLVAGHLVCGEDHLRNKFNEVAGKDEYDKIFHPNLSEQEMKLYKDNPANFELDRLAELQRIYYEKETDINKQINVRDNVSDILKEGKYNV
jgi:hypothetical protein